MSTKLLACVLAAVLVTAGGAFYYHGGSHGCGGCPLGLLMSSEASCDDTATCPQGGTPDCPLTKSTESTSHSACCLVSTPAPSPAACCEISCCDAKPADAFAAGFGGAASAAKGLK
jgi:hypothetical protein